MIRRADEFGEPPSEDIDLPLEIDPLEPSKNAMEVFVLVLCIITGVMIILGRETVNAEVEPFFRWAWRIMILAGPLAVLAGMVWRGRSFVANMQQELGYLGISTAAVAYGVASREWTIVVFGFFAFWRSVQIADTVEKVFPGTSTFHTIWRGVRLAWEKVIYRA